MVDAVDVLVGEVVQRGCGDVARSEREHGPEHMSGKRRRTVCTNGAEEHEHRDHRRDAVAQQHDVQPGQARHFGVTTFSGQIDVSTST
jgi:hypothetical protein